MTDIDTHYPGEDENACYDLAHFLVLLRTQKNRFRLRSLPIPTEVTRENVNRVIFDGDTLLDMIVREGRDYFRAVQQLLALGARIQFFTLDLCHFTRTFHLLLQYGGYRHVTWSPYNVRLWENYNSLSYERRWTLLLEYDIKVDFWNKPHIHKVFYPTRDKVQGRVDTCRKALLTLIWMGKQLHYEPLKPLFITWAKWIWSMGPYTNDLQPSIGPRSPIWELE